MKREILCVPCAHTVSRAVTGSRFVNGEIVDPFPGEHAKFLTGKLTHHCLCDFCSKELSPGNEAVAASIWADYGGVPYHPWEAEYLRSDPNGGLLEVCS
jgi:hypothetical protein